MVAREGLPGVSLRLVAQESGWSIGSMRYYFTTKAELLTFTVRTAGERLSERIGRLPGSGTVVDRLRAAVAELVPLDVTRREEGTLWLTLVAQATVDPALTPVAEQIWCRLHAPLADRLSAAVNAGELSAELDVDREATRLQALLDGLNVHLLSAPAHVTPRIALDIVNAHITALPATGPSSRPPG